jgi:UDP-2,3-diacylglucosamine pyrophosphatase LpxH
VGLGGGRLGLRIGDEDKVWLVLHGGSLATGHTAYHDALYRARAPLLSALIIRARFRWAVARRGIAAHQCIRHRRAVRMKWTDSPAPR